MAEVFAWSPLVEPQGSNTLRVRKAQFGDGYAQVVRDGINNRVRSWSLQFGGPNSLVDQIEAFLVARGGAESFLWTPRGGAQGLFLCTSFVRTPVSYGVAQLSATFEEWFAP